MEDLSLYTVGKIRGNNSDTNNYHIVSNIKPVRNKLLLQYVGEKRFIF